MTVVDNTRSSISLIINSHREVMLMDISKIELFVPNIVKK